MTDEERAENYVESYGFVDDLINLIGCEVNQSIKKGFLEGLQAGRLVWHDLRKDKNDLPGDSRYVWTNVGAGYHDEDGWWDSFGRLQGVIAWCEPKFEEEIK